MRVRMVLDDGEPIAVLPSLEILGSSDKRATVGADLPFKLAQRRSMALVGSKAIALEVMQRLRLTADEIIDRLNVAGL